VAGLLHTPGDLIDHLMRASISQQARWIDDNGDNMFQASEAKTFRMIEIDSASGAASLYTVTPSPRRSPCARCQACSFGVERAEAILAFAVRHGQPVMLRCRCPNRPDMVLV
jgi:hypothetical protein